MKCVKQMPAHSGQSSSWMRTAGRKAFADSISYTNSGEALAPLDVCWRGYLLGGLVEDDDLLDEVGFGFDLQFRARCPCLPQLWHFWVSFLVLGDLIGRHLLLALVLTERLV